VYKNKMLHEYLHDFMLSNYLRLPTPHSWQCRELLAMLPHHQICLLFHMNKKLPHGTSKWCKSENVFTINSLMQNGLKSTYIDETHVDLGPLTLWYEQLF